MYDNLAVFAVFVFAFSLFSGRIEKSRFSGPMIFVLFGIIAGPVGLNILKIEVGSLEMRAIADVTLALILFIDAANADLSVLRKHSLIPKRMLIVGLPLTILAGFGAGFLIFDQLSLFELAILATMLAATDAALGKGVITNTHVPERLREGLNLESGLNDGICVPILFLFLALAVGYEYSGQTSTLALSLVAQELGIGLLVGCGVAVGGSYALTWASDRGLITSIWGQLPVVALALSAFAIAQGLHGSGYVAAFVGGLLFGRLQGGRTHELVHAAEGIGETLALVTWVVFGAVVVGQSWEYFTPQVVLYALLSLTVIRMVPMYIALAGTGESHSSKLFLGWFGPRGLASIVFMIIVAEQKLPGNQTLVLTVFCTVLLSVVLHGMTANPLANRIGRAAAGQDTVA